MLRREFLMSGGAMLCVPLPAFGQLVPGADVAQVIWQELDALALQPLSERGAGALDVLNLISASPVEEQAHPSVQSGMRLAAEWLGHAMLQARDTMAAIVNGAALDEDELDRCLATAMMGRTRKERRALSAFRKGMTTERRVRVARRTVQHIDRLHQQATDGTVHGLEEVTVSPLEHNVVQRLHRLHPPSKGLSDMSVLQILGLLLGAIMVIQGFGLVVFGLVAVLMSAALGEGMGVLSSLGVLLLGGLLLFGGIWLLRRILKRSREQRVQAAVQLHTAQALLP